MAMRTTQRSGRAGSAKHNDRSFLDKDGVAADHIDRERLSENKYISMLGKNQNFEEAERAFYEMRYGKAQELRNARYIKSGHRDRCKTTDDLYEGKLTRPEELILQVGDMKEHISSEELWGMAKEYINSFNEWNKSHGNHGHILSVALHSDEATPHVHLRRVWDYEKDGITELGQAKALEQAGVELPDPTKEAGRYNNRKMSFDAMMREKWQEICKGHGYEIETEPRPTKKHKQKADFIAGKLAEELEEKKQALEALSEQVAEAEKLKAELRGLKASVADLQTVERILSKAEVEDVVERAKVSKLDSSKVVVSRKDFESLARTAHGAEEAIRQARASAKPLDLAQAEASKIVAAAKNKADAIVARADSVWKESAISQLEKIKEDYPQIFNIHGVYQRGAELFRQDFTHSHSKDIEH